MNTYILFIISLILVLLVVDNESVSVGSYNPKYIPTNIEDTTIQDKARDVGVSFIHAGLSSLPGEFSINVFGRLLKKGLTIAPYIDCAFSIILTIFNFGPQYITKEEFEHRLSEVFRNMTIYVDNKIEDSIIETARIQYESLRIPLINLRLMLDLMDYEKNTTSKVSDRTKDSIVANYWVTVNLLEQALSQFGDRSRVHMMGILYFESATLLASIYRDSLIYGIDMGLPPLIVNNNNNNNTHIPTISKKIVDLSSSVLNKYSEMLNNIIIIQNRNSNIKKEEKNLNKDYLNRNNYRLPKQSSMVSSFHYSNIDLYNNSIVFINEVPKDSDYIEYSRTSYVKYKALKININEPIGTIYVIDAYFLGKYLYKNDKSYVKVKRINIKSKQISDWVTGVKGIYYYSTQEESFGILSMFLNLNKFITTLRFRIYYADTIEFHSGAIKNNTINFRLSSTLTPNGKDDYNLKYKLYCGNTIKSNYTTRIITKPFKEISGRYMLETSPFEIKGFLLDIKIIPIVPFDLPILSIEILT